MYPHLISPKKLDKTRLLSQGCFCSSNQNQNKSVGSNQNLDCNDKYSRDTVILFGKESDKEEEGDV
jgi:hypothetical protein